MKPKLMQSPTLIALCVSAGYSVSAVAQEVGANKTEQLDEIIVVGEKFERSQSQTGSSVDVTTDGQLKKSGNLFSLTQLLKRSGNILDTGLGNDLTSIRGIDGAGPGAVAFFAGARPRINMQIDGRTATYNELGYGTKSLWDMKQVEIYKGPQSYAQGRNAVSGAIIMTSHDPSNEFEGAAKFNIGNQHHLQTAAMISGPLINNELLFRLSVDHQRRKSFEELATYSPVGDSRLAKTTTTRAKLLWVPSAFPDFYSRFTFNHINSRNPQGEGVPNQVSTANRPVFETRSATNIWDIGYQFSNGWKIENKLLYGTYIHNRLSLPFPGGAPARVDGREFQAEPIVKFKSTKQDYSGLLGLFYFQAKQDEYVVMNVKNDYKDKTKTKALFGEFSFAPTLTTEITLFARYEEELHKRSGGVARFALEHDKKYRVFLPKIDVAWKPDEEQRLGFKIGRGYNPGGAGITFAPPFKTYTFEPEYVWNYELYHRWKTLNNRLSVKTNLFYNDYKNMQIPFTIGRAVVIHNADKVITYGAELNLDWQLTDNFHFYTGLGLLKTKIKAYPEADLEGNRLARAPNYTFNVGATYSFFEHWEIGGDMRFTDGYYSTYSNDRTTRIGSYSQTNLYTAYNFKYGRVMLYADNIFNSRKNIITTALGTTKQQPRLIGLSTELRF